MKQITEDYVSFETAKLLKEKGFDDEPTRYYRIKDEIIVSSRFIKDTEGLKKTKDFEQKYIQAPTQSLALKWLREVHNIFIEIKYVPNQFTDEPGYKAMIWDMSEEIGRPMPDDIEYAFYETCVNNALKYTLQNFI